MKDGDQRVLLSPDPRWLVSRGSDEARRLQKQFRPGMTSREDSDLKKALKAVVPVTALVDLGAKDLPASRRVLNRAGEPKAVSPDGRWLVTGGQDVPLLWPLAGAGAPIALKEHTKTLDGAAFSADGRWLLTGGYDGGARLWDLAAKEVATSSRLLTQREFSIGTVAFSPDGRLLLAAGHDQTQLWELGADGTLSPSMALPVDAARVWGATFTPDGRWLVTRSYDTKTLSVWTLALDTLLCLACRTAGRNLTSDEARAYFPGQPAPAPCAAH